MYTVTFNNIPVKSQVLFLLGLLSHLTLKIIGKVILLLFCYFYFYFVLLAVYMYACMIGMHRYYCITIISGHESTIHQWVALRSCHITSLLQMCTISGCSDSKMDDCMNETG